MSKELGKSKPGEIAFGGTTVEKNQGEQLLGNSVIHQELGKGSDEEAYESEKRHKSFQRRNKSFDEQRDQYAEHAMNQSEATTTFYSPQNITNEESSSPPVEEGDYKRYVTHPNNDSAFTETGYYSEIPASDSGRVFSKLPDYQEQEKSDSKNTLAGRIAFESDGVRQRSTSKKGRYRLSSSKNSMKLETRNSGSSDRIHSKIASSGRLQFREEKNHKFAGSEIRNVGAQRFRSGMSWRIFSRMISEHPSADEEETDAINTLRNTSLTLSRNLLFLKKTRKLKSELENSHRLENQRIRLNAERQSGRNNSGPASQKRKAEETARQKQLREKERKKKIKKEMVQTYHREQTSFVRRTSRQRKLKRVTKKERVIVGKKTKAIIGGLGSLFLVFLVLLLPILICIAVGACIFSETYVNSTSQNTYWDMSAVTGYFRQKEADLEEYIKPENLEPMILEEEPDIYEFIYELDEISFDANTLVAYLSARYNEFNLEMVKEDLDEIFKQYYTLSYEIKMEYRKVPDKTQPIDPDTGTYPLVEKLVPICYVRLEKANFYELLKKRIEDEAKQGQMDAFYLTGNGQQIYGPVMNLDWRNKISSNYGERIHPITGERKKHNGVDIAVPTGTALYSAVTGTVIDSHYSTSAGNMITVQTASGWKVTFMHMDSRAVSIGDEVIQGQLVGYSGNTGNSTGPHLHLEVKNESGEYVNPVFIIPFSTVESSETFKEEK